MSYNPQNPNGQATSTNSSPVVLSNDQNTFTTTSSIPLILSGPTSNSMAALNATVQYTVQAGASYLLTLTNAPAVTTTWAGTVTFQYSTNGGSTYSSLTAIPVSPGLANTSTSTVVGLWAVQIPAGVGSQSVIIRANMTSYTSGTAYFFVSNSSLGTRVPLPWTPSVTSGVTIVPAMDASLFSDALFQLTAITTTVYTAQATSDPTVTTWDVLPVQGVQNNTSLAGTMNSAQSWNINLRGFKYFRIQTTTTGTVGSIQGVSATLGQTIGLSSFGSSISIGAGTITTVTSVTQLNGNVPNLNISNGSTLKAITTATAAATTNTDYSAQAWAAVSGNGATIADAIGDGQSVSFAVNLTAWTAGASTGLYVYLQESPDNGTTWTDIWGCEPFTAIGIARIPAIPIGGRRRMRWVNRAGAATTATVTVTAIKSPSAFVTQRQFFDWGTTGTAANSNLITGAPATTSTSTITSALGTTGQNTAAFPIDGCKLVTLKCLVSGGTAITAPVFTIQVSDDFLNWVNTSTTLTAPLVAGMSMVTLNGITAKYVRAQLTTAQTGGTPVALTYLSFTGVN